MENKRAVLLINTGAATCGGQLPPIEQAMKQPYPFYSVYSMDIVRERLKKQGYLAPSLDEQLSHLVATGISELAVQPTNLLCAYEYEKIMKHLERWRPFFSKLVVGDPLIASSDDLKEICSVLCRQYPFIEKRAVVCVGHGTAHHTNTAYAALQTVFSLLNRPDILVGTIKSFPLYDDVLQLLRAGNYRDVLLVPFLFSAGNHVLFDINGDGADSFKMRLQENGFSVSCVEKGLSELPEICEIYAKHLQKILDTL